MFSTRSVFYKISAMSLCCFKAQQYNLNQSRTSINSVPMIGHNVCQIEFLKYGEPSIQKDNKSEPKVKKRGKVKDLLSFGISESRYF